MYYKTNSFPDSLCLLWNQKQSAELLANERGDYITTEERRGIGIDGSTKLRIR